ncbi:ABC transporter permease [Sulfuricystis multivorans]|uniref:ABC transporter permease n=1 Tax=Sulfuricystis multivorans TaxID=2211108 RepID=UPI000F84B836|nr:FtsX-like permease family protein [Sulfuricystis multivorans]
MLRMLARDFRAGELTVVFVALMLAVAALTSVGFLADRVRHAVEREAHQLLGGDLLLSADHPWPEAYREAARQHGLRLAESALLLSMVGNPEGAGNVQLGEIKAISPGYPLRGALEVEPFNDKVGAGGSAHPLSLGTVWPDERLATALALEPGTKVRIGALTASVGGILTLDPERGINPFAFAPRLIVNLADLPATGLIQPGSRITWRLHLAGDEEAVRAFRAWAQPRLGRGEKLEGLDDARPEVRVIIERAERFLRLAALLTVVLATIAVGMAARRFMQRHLDACAVMRVFGASERQILMIHGGEFVLLGALATLFGGLCGLLAQQALHGMLAGLLAERLPAPGALPWLHGGTVAAVLVVGFAVPPLLRLKSVPALRVLRREWGRVAPLSMASYLVGGACLAGLMFWMAGEARLAAVVLGGFLAAIAIYALIGRLLLEIVVRLAVRLACGGWRIGVVRLRRHGSASLLQVVSLALGLTTLLLLSLVKNDLLVAWQTKLPPDAPNRFLINIQPEQRAAVTEFLARAGLPAPRLEPMVRGRLVAVNGRPIGPQDFADERARRLVEREFNLTQRDDLPLGNTIIAGQWFGNATTMQFSVEQGLASTLGLKLGDELSFEVAGQRFSGPVTSLRKLDWDSMRVNFFVIAPQGALDGQPTSYITSFHLPAGREALTSALVRSFPNVTVIDVVALVRQLQQTVGQVIGALQLVFLFALIAGLTVLYAAIETSNGARSQELAVMRALGGQRRQLRQSVLAEFALQGAIAGLMAGGGATAIGALLARQVFGFEYWPKVEVLAIGFAAGLVGVALFGMIAARRAFSGRVIDRLREG